MIDAIEKDGGIGARGGRRGIDPDDHYGALVRAIIGQQLSAKVAYVMNERLLERFGGRPPPRRRSWPRTPRSSAPRSGCRGIPKVAFLRSLAKHVTDASLQLEKMDELSDEDVIAELVAVKGIGEWTAHMFLIFHLQRPDVLAVGDLGIRSAIKGAYELAELPGPSEMEDDRGALASLPLGCLPLPLALAGQHAGLGSPNCRRPGVAAGDRSAFRARPRRARAQTSGRCGRGRRRRGRRGSWGPRAACIGRRR